jgi:hypothetical protein
MCILLRMYKQINIHTQARASRFINLFQTSVRLCTVYIDVLHELALSQIVLLRVLTAHATEQLVLTHVRRAMHNR